MKIIKRKFDSYHISQDDLKKKEKAILAEWQQKNESGLHHQATIFIHQIWRIHWRLAKYYGIKLPWIPQKIKQKTEQFDPHHVSFDTVKAIETSAPESLESLNEPWLGELIPSILYTVWLFHLRVKKRLPLNCSILLKTLASQLTRYQSCIVVLMGGNFKKCLPYFNFAQHKGIYLFDAWPPFHENIKTFVNDYKIDVVFVSSSQAANQLQQLVPNTNFHWVPEAIDTNEYKFYPLERKDIDILSFGRKYDFYHQQIVDFLAKEKITYLYEQSPGLSVFPSRETFADGLARTKISLCFPLSLTNPHKAGGIETMTNRYLESMASKCLIVGHAPEEMIRLFGYNPVIEVNWQDPAGQLVFILNNYDNFLELIERNYELVIQQHSWKHRWAQILEMLSQLNW